MPTSTHLLIRWRRFTCIEYDNVRQLNHAQLLSKIMLALLRQRLTGSLTTSLSKLVSTSICIGIGQKQPFPLALDDTVILNPYQGVRRENQSSAEAKAHRISKESLKDWYPNTSIIHNVKAMPMIHPGNNDTVIPSTIYKPAGMPELLRQRLTGSVHEWLTRLVPKHIYKQNLKTMAAPSAQSQEPSKAPASKAHLVENA